MVIIGKIFLPEFSLIPGMLDRKLKCFFCDDDETQFRGTQGKKDAGL